MPPCWMRATPSVYPRWRGEHHICESSSKIASGLSPLARGTHQRLPADCGKIRFIPAGAGNTARWPVSWGFLAVYPRWRGEHPSSLLKSASLAGLSPLARGTPREARYLYSRLRFIPAGAGNTRDFVRSAEIVAVYPRWRGEHRLPAREAAADHGLSPLARGTQYRRRS